MGARTGKTFELAATSGHYFYLASPFDCRRFGLATCDRHPFAAGFSYFALNQPRFSRLRLLLRERDATSTEARTRKGGVRYPHLVASCGLATRTICPPPSTPS